MYCCEERDFKVLGMLMQLMTDSKELKEKGIVQVKRSKEYYIALLEIIAPIASVDSLKISAPQNISADTACYY